MRVLTIQNSANGRPGYLGGWLQRRGDDVQVVANAALPPPKTLRDVDLLVVLGSSAGVHDDEPWIAPERAFVRAALEHGTPTVGICFGAQLIAQILGGTVEEGRRYSGWLSNDVVTDERWRGPWLRWHGDRLSAPSGAAVLARSAETVQAFQTGRALGVQFHPEADASILDAWIRTASERALAGVDVAALRAESQHRFRENAKGRDRLFAEIVARVTG